MSTVVGVLQVDLISRTASFQNDLGTAADKARDSFSRIRSSAGEMGRGVGSSMRESREGLMLLGEEFGVHLPRGVTSFIASIGPVGAAMEAAFPWLAIIAGATLLIEHLVKVGEEAQKEAQKIDDAFVKTISSLDSQITSLQRDLQTPTQRDVFDLKAAQVNLDAINKKVDEAKAKLDALQHPVFDLTFQQQVHHEAATPRPLNDQDRAAIAAQQQELQKLEAEREVLSLKAQKAEQDYTKVTEDEANKRTTASLQSLNKINTAHDALINAAITSEKAYADQNLTTAQREIEANNGLIAKLQDEIDLGKVNAAQKAADVAHIETLRQQNQQLAEQVDLESKLAAVKERQAEDAKNYARIFVGLDDEQKQVISDDQRATQEAEKIRDSIKSVNQKYAEQVALITTLHDQGKLTDTEFQQALKAQHDALTKNNKDWEQFGQKIGNVIEQSALMGRSWTDALKAILVDVAELMLKMTLLRQLQQSGAGGGFVGSLLGGLFGGFHADGGTIPPGKFGITGEAGPEVTYGGMSGVTVYPIRHSGNSSTQVIYQIDARGADAGVEQRIRRAIAESENRAVARSVTMTHDMSRRRSN